MTLSTYVAALAWSSTFAAFWYCFITSRKDWTGFALIFFSFVIAVFASSVAGRKDK